MELTLLWAGVVVLLVVGLAGTVLPILPGTGLVLAGAVLGAWIDDFTRVGLWALGLIAALAVLSWVLEYWAGVLGAQRVGASREALIGVAIGTVVGLLMGLVGVLFMPLVGAAVGEYLARRSRPQAATQAVRVGLATGAATLFGLLAKVVLGFTMTGIFLVALWV